MLGASFGPLSELCLLLDWEVEVHYRRCWLSDWARWHDIHAYIAVKESLALAADGRSGQDLAGRYHIGAANVHTWVAVITSGLPAGHAASHASDVRVALRLVHSSLVVDIACHGAFSSHVDRIDIGIGVQWDLRCNSRVMFSQVGHSVDGWSHGARGNGGDGLLLFVFIRLVQPLMLSSFHLCMWGAPMP